ncbi:hypothetical protein Tco_1528453, partial [Tanacetum coccineum]
IYWIKGNDEVELTDEESSDNEDEIAEVFRIDTNIFDYETPICSAFKDASMADIMDLLRLEETSLAFSLEVAHNRVLRLRGDATAHRLSLADSMLPLIEPLSARNLTGEASSSADVTTTMTTALSTTFAQTNPVPETLSTLVPPSPKIVFEEEELDTTTEHIPAP